MLLNLTRHIRAFRRINTISQGFCRPISDFGRSAKEYDVESIARMKQWSVMKARSKPRIFDKMPKRHGQKRKRDGVAIEGSNEEVLEFEVRALLAKGASSRGNTSSDSQKDKNARDTDSNAVHSLPERFSEIELDILELSSTGDGLALSASADHVYTVPFSLPGETVLAKVVTQTEGRPYSATDFVKIIKPSPKRDDTGIGCKYFSKCSGCQLQMLPYEEQLKHKKTVLEKAYRNFSGLNPRQIPPIQDTFGSPRQYGYRTKLTPHFDGPGRIGDRNSAKKYTEVPAIGFAEKGRKRVMDIESCPIATDIVEKGLTRERARVGKEIASFKNGATILLRETTERIPKSPKPSSDDANTANDTNSAVSTTTVDDSGKPTILTEFPTYIESKSYTSDMKGISTEYIEDWKFTNTAGAFFQNNNSILAPFTAYIREHCIPPPTPTTTSDSPPPPIKYLLDAYCGSGLFAITLSPLFTSTLGVDVAQISFARANAAANNVSNCGFIEADASDLFIDVPFPPDQTLLVIDPPRKGASEDFLKQLLRFGPKRVVYVSCNVHTQARDVGILVRGDRTWKYSIESLRGFDFFPQTGHVEGVALLNREAVSTPPAA